MIALFLLMLAAAPAPESAGSVDGPFLWVDARASADGTHFLGEGVGVPLSNVFASGISVLGQGQLFGGWGLRVLNRRLTLSAALTATGVVTNPHLTNGNQAWARRAPRFGLAPLLLSAAITLPYQGVVFVPLLGLTLPTKDAFFHDPIVALQPQLRVRAQAGSFLFGASALLNVPIVTLWGPRDYNQQRPWLRCPPDETRCRMPVARELWRVAASLQGEFWAWDALSVGLRAALEFREDDVAELFSPSASPEGTLHMGPRWSVFEVRGALFGSWAFFENFGVTASVGPSFQRRVSLVVGNTVGNSWEASLSVWFRTDSRLNRMWLDR